MFPIFRDRAVFACQHGSPKAFSTQPGKTNDEQEEAIAGTWTLLFSGGNIQIGVPFAERKQVVQRGHIT